MAACYRNAAFMPFSCVSKKHRMNSTVKLWQNSLCEKTLLNKAVSIVTGIFVSVLN